MELRSSAIFCVDRGSSTDQTEIKLACFQELRPDKRGYGQVWQIDPFAETVRKNTRSKQVKVTHREEQNTKASAFPHASASYLAMQTENKRLVFE